MAQTVVHRLEPVEVEQQQRESAGVRCGGQRLVEGPAVCQTGQRIPPGRRIEFALGDQQRLDLTNDVARRLIDGPEVESEQCGDAEPDRVAGEC